MSSAEFMNIFQNAIELAKFHLREEPGIKVATEHLIKRADPSEAGISISDLYEPVLESQLLGVPIRTVQLLAEELLKMRVFRLRVRVTCPDRADDMDNVIFETESSEEFEKKLEEVCCHCGRIHDSPAWECIDPVFGLNRDLGDSDIFEDCNFLADRPLVAE